ncbi:hypothetical protein TNIN_274651 [Trichonephila inaurata madagascariensis]|uniref:Uncharacterized protein n=1 Tax=Trichonephila inaurata madagascariensis TaxID=2747483 RepID=A0A8X7BWQ0_9ARAC|nr:hypothetical protein TNIN_274651 [Trichonephila inaurata madagascariensis]
MKLAEKVVPVCKDQSLMVLSEEVTVKDKEIAQLKADVKKQKGKLQTIEEANNSPQNLEMSNKSMQMKFPKFT